LDSDEVGIVIPKKGKLQVTLLPSSLTVEDAHICTVTAGRRTKSCTPRQSKSRYDLIQDPSKTANIGLHERIFVFTTIEKMA
jgi:hypothetical protein